MKHTLLILFAALLALTTANAQTTPDPGLPGSLPVTKAYYDFGDLAATLPSFPSATEVRGSVHYPTGLAGGPYPVIFLLHGRHSTCYNTSTLATSSTWPCPSGRLPIQSYEGYDYFARNMASRGYIVISISCNAINAGDASLSDYGQNARGELVQYHMRLWDSINTASHAPFGTTFVGKLDMQNIGTMGHSRGGEGVIMNALLNKSLGSPYGIKAIITLAPVDFLRRAVTGIPLMNVAPYCDGDVSNLSGVRYYDDARYLDTMDETPKYSVLMMGADHNFYNTVWTPGSYIAGGVDDWTYSGSASEAYCGRSAPTNKRFDSTKQKAAFNAYGSAFYRIFLGKEYQFEPILDVRDIIPPASSMLDTTNCYVSYHPGRSLRRDVNRGDTVVDITTNTMAAAVTSTGMATSTICGGGLSMASCNIASSTTQEPHRGTTSAKGLAQINLIWNDTTDSYQNDIPATRQDLSLVHSLQFRTAQNYTKCTTNQKLNFTVQLIDSAGAIASQTVNSNSHALFYQPGNQSGVLPKVLFNTIRIPIANFTGINRTKVRHIKFLFNKFDSGAILVSDIAFVNDLCGAFNVAIGSVMGTGHNVNFKDTLTGNGGDTLSWVWNFGDPTSGINDTSTAHNPTHNYLTTGSHTACIYVKLKRAGGRVCTDTVCKTINITGVGVETVNKDEINIYPNPATHVLYITGAAPTDVLRLENTLGQIVLTTTLTSTSVQLPTTLANGMYYAEIQTDKGIVYKKIIVSR